MRGFSFDNSYKHKRPGAQGGLMAQRKNYLIVFELKELAAIVLAFEHYQTQLEPKGVTKRMKAALKTAEDRSSSQADSVVPKTISFCMKIPNIR